MVVVAERLPKSRLVVIEQFETSYPFGALPKVQVRNEQPGGPTMFGCEILVVELKGDSGFAVTQVGHGKVGRVIRFGKREDVPRSALDSREEHIE